MKRLFLFFSFLAIFCSLSASEIQTRPGDSRSHTVLVSIAPYRWLVKQIAQDHVKVSVLVPSAASMHTYEPTPKQMIGASKADIWFQVGENFENKALSALQSYNNNLKVVDLRDSVDLICTQPNQGCAHCSGGCDLHFWVDPQIMKQQAELIAMQLSRLYPEYAESFRVSLKEVQAELDNLNSETETILKNLKNRTFFVSHPAYAYYARQYNLSQFSIEFEGRDPTPKQLEKILNTAKELNVKTIFIQRQYNNKGARLVADQLGAKLVMLDPYAEDYLNQMRKMAAQISAK
jgi:zinc transport system substrate-binding protein